MIQGADVPKLHVWHALSELFLDTELRSEDYRRIARDLAGCGYDRDEIRSILFDEVAPAFAPNMLSAAGVWEGWSEEAVREMVERSRRSPRPLRWLLRRLVLRQVEQEWAELAAQLGAP